MISNALKDKKLPVYGDGNQVRDWIHVQDHCEAVWEVYTKGKDGEVYNIGGNNEQKNIDIVKLILKKLEKSEDLIEYVKDRPGHDRRYAMDNTYITSQIGWNPRIRFETGLSDTIDWYLTNKEWWEKIRTGEYLEFYDKQYKKKD